MATTRLASIDGELQRPQKSVSATTSATLTLTASAQDVLFGGNAGLDIGGAPCVGFVGKWTPNATATKVTFEAFVSNDGGSTWAPCPYIPSVLAATANGASTAYPQTVAFNKADWGNVTTEMDIAFTIHAPGFRTMKIQATSDSATGSPTLILQAAAGTQS